MGSSPRPTSRKSLGGTKQDVFETTMPSSVGSSLYQPSPIWPVSPQGVDVRDVFCQSLIVEEKTGATVNICGNGGKPPVDSKPEEGLFTVMNCGTQKVIMHGLTSETGHHKGILLESAPSFPIAYIDTSEAFDTGGQRTVTICWPGDTEFNASVHAPYAFVGKFDEKFKVWRTHENSPKGHCMYTIEQSKNTDGLHITMINAQERIIATRNPGHNNSFQIEASYKSDMGLVICAILAVVKLS